MASVRSKVALQLGAFFRVTTNVVSAVDDDDREVSLRTVCAGTGLPKVDEKGKAVLDKGKPVLHLHPPTAIQSVYKCPTCENTDKTTLKKASVSGSVFTIVDEAAIAATAVAEDMKAKIDLQVHKASDLVGTTLPGGKVYFLEPGKGEEAVYALFWRMVADSPDLAFVAQWAARTKPALYRLVTFDKALVIQQIAWPSSLRAAPGVDVPADEANLGMAKMIANAAVTAYDPAAYRDGRKDDLLAVIAAAEGVEGVVPTAEAGPVKAAPVGSLTAMLQAQLSAMQPVAPVAAVPAPRKRAPRKKPATVTPIKAA